MPKITLDSVASGYNLSKINSNFTTIAAALNDDVLWRDNPVGEANALVTSLDANSQSVYNLADPVLDTEPVTLGYLNTNYGDTVSLVAASDAAIAAAAAADIDAIAAAASAAAAAISAAEAAAAVTGDVSSNTGVAVDSEIALFSGVGGKTIKRATTTGVLKATSGVIAAAVAGTDYLAPAAIGVTVQGYDVDTAKLDVTQAYTAPQRAPVLTDNDLSFDLGAKQNFGCTPTAGGTLTFTNIPDGQSGYIILINGSNYAIAAHANTKISAAALTTISATGTYRLDYATYSGNVYVTTTGTFA